MTLPESSKHLGFVLSNRFGSVDSQVVFLDIVAYSKRKSSTQRKIVECLQNDVSNVITEIGKDHLDYIQKNGLNLSNDVVKIPTGDGMAIGFSFSGLHALGLEFSIEFLKRIYEIANSEQCEKFVANGWCNCHNHYLVRIGINDGKSILFVDTNGQVNISGATINDAARIMAVGDPMQILMSRSTYSNIIDMSTDNAIDDKLVDRGTSKVKHGEIVSIYQYIGLDEPYINREPPMDMVIRAELEANMNKMGLPSIFQGKNEDKTRMLEISRSFGVLMDQIGLADPPPKDVSPKK